MIELTYLQFVSTIVLGMLVGASLTLCLAAAFSRMSDPEGCDCDKSEYL
jgi:hypothetical protein